MKKTTTALFAGSAALTLAACSPAEEPAVEETATEEMSEDTTVAEDTVPVEPNEGVEEDPLEGTGNPIGPNVPDAEAE